MASGITLRKKGVVPTMATKAVPLRVTALIKNAR
jgi:hypothetical protein